MFKMIAVSALSLSVLLGVGGCGRESGGGASTVAVVNMEAVFKAKGWGAELEARLRTDQEVMNKSMSEITAALQKLIAEHRKGIADKYPDAADKKAIMEASNIEQLNKISTLSADQKKEIMDAAANANQQLEIQRQQHQQVFNNRRNTLLQQYLQAITPIAVAVAERRGFTVMINTGGQVIWAASTVDITSEVSKEVGAQQITIQPLPNATQPGLQ